MSNVSANSNIVGRVKTKDIIIDDPYGDAQLIDPSLSTEGQKLDSYSGRDSDFSRALHSVEPGSVLNFVADGAKKLSFGRKLRGKNSQNFEKGLRYFHLNNEKASFHAAQLDLENKVLMNFRLASGDRAIPHPVFDKLVNEYKGKKLLPHDQTFNIFSSHTPALPPVDNDNRQMQSITATFERKTMFDEAKQWLADRFAKDQTLPYFAQFDFDTGGCIRSGLAPLSYFQSLLKPGITPNTFSPVYQDGDNLNYAVVDLDEQLVSVEMFQGVKYKSNAALEQMRSEDSSENAAHQPLLLYAKRDFDRAFANGEFEYSLVNSKLNTDYDLHTDAAVDRLVDLLTKSFKDNGGEIDTVFLSTLGSDILEYDSSNQFADKVFEGLAKNNIDLRSIVLSPMDGIAQTFFNHQILADAKMTGIYD